MRRFSALVVSLSVIVLISSVAYAVNYQEGQTVNCTTDNICRTEEFRNPGAGISLRITHLTCKLLTSERAPAWVIQFFDGNNALYIPTVIQDDEGRSFVATTGAMTFFSGGGNMRVEALLGASMDAQLSCTLTGTHN